MATTLTQLKSSRNYPGLFISTIDPTGAANSTTGYVKGMIWVNTSTNAIFMCIDDTTPTWTTVTAAGTAKNNVTVTAPTASSDSSLGYGPGSIWVNTVTHQAYVNVDSTPAAAVWKNITSSGALNTSAASAPLLTSDSAAGYSIGSLWWDSATNTQYIATSVGVGAAAWFPLNTIKNNFAATAAPLATNDGSQGYSNGSRWIDSTTGNIYTATSVATGAAVWSAGGGAAGTVSATPPASPSSGDLWYNTANDLTYIYSGTAWIDIVNAGTGGAKNNYTATTAPLATNDSTQGYGVGSRWIDTTTGMVYTATSVATGTAVWSSGTVNHFTKLKVGGGVANIYTATSAAGTTPVTTLYTGMSITVPITVTNTGASTLSLDGLPAIPITKNGVAVIAGEMTLSSMILDYNGTSWEISTSNPIGVGQRWTDVVATRALGVTYTNTTGRTINVAVETVMGAVSGRVGFSVDGITVGAASAAPAGNRSTGNVLVPAGSTYSGTGSAQVTLALWSELR